MIKKFSKFLGGLSVAALLTMAGTGAVFAQTTVGTPGDGPANAVMPAAGVVSIEPGQWQWYAFRSQAPFVDDDDEPVWDDAVIDAALRVQSGTVDFEVWSAADLNHWIDGTDFDATGIGTTNEALPGDPLFWQGSFEGNNTYYLIVKSRSAQESFYALNISGDVTFPTTLVLGDETQPAMAQAVSSEEMGLTVEPAAEATTVGVDAATAAMPSSSSVEIQPGQWQWYRFTAQAPFVADEEDTTTEYAKIDAALRVQSGTASFEVWSAQNFNDWRDGVDFDATGIGTKNESLSGDPLFWQGSFQGNDSLYLIVKNTGTTPVVYTLNITGDVTFPATLPVQ